MVIVWGMDCRVVGRGTWRLGRGCGSLFVGGGIGDSGLGRFSGGVGMVRSRIDFEVGVDWIY